MLTVRVWLFLAMTLFVSFFATELAYAEPMTMEQEEEILQEQGFRRWEWLKADCYSCQMVILTTHPELRTEKVLLFLQALSTFKYELLNAYPEVHGEEYNLLAHMAVGILGRESKFFESNRYFFKETLPGAVKLLKIIKIFLSENHKKLSPNSRGPTQIKVVPEVIAKKYGVTTDSLNNPTHAALATMGYLLDALPELKRRAKNNNLEFITPQTYPDYLPYIYFGSTRALLGRTATPDKNIYIKDMRKYMSWFRVYQRPYTRPLN